MSNARQPGRWVDLRSFDDKPFAAAVAALKQLLPAHRVWDRFPTTGRLAD